MANHRCSWFKSLRHLMLLTCTLALFGCVGTPNGVKPVEPFDLSRYQGKWYEIARLDHSFEQGLEQVTAEYTIRDDGLVTVVNRGFSPEKNVWKEAVGKATFVDATNQGFLKVSFFGPFYASYIVFGLDQKDYSYAFISGPNQNYLWLLARSPSVAPTVLAEFVAQAKALGFDTSKLIYVNQK